jgi:N-acetylglucosaminyl-diphospho-decaprenol L-rhamnosyltransferase
MTLSIIILSYRNPALLRLCLKSLARVLSGTTLAYEVIVVDNATSPETANVVHSDFAGVFSLLRLIPLRNNSGYTFCLNECIRVARGEYILSLNHDIILEPGVIEQLIEYLRQHPKVGMAGPRLLNFDDSRQDSCFRFYTPLTVIARRFPLPFSRKVVDRFLMRDVELSGPTSVDWVSGAAFMTTRRAIDRVGLMDEGLFHYFSDVDWAWRFWENGLAVMYYPMGSLYHYLGRTSKGKSALVDLITNHATRWHIIDAIRYFRKHGISGKRPESSGPLQPELLDA